MKAFYYDFNETILAAIRQMNDKKAKRTLAALDDYAARALISLPFAEVFVEQRLIPLIIWQQKRITELESRVEEKIEDLQHDSSEHNLTPAEIDKADGLAQGIPE